MADEDEGWRPKSAVPTTGVGGMDLSQITDFAGMGITNPGQMMTPGQRIDFVRSLLFSGELAMSDVLAGQIELAPGQMFRLPQPLLRRSPLSYQPAPHVQMGTGTDPRADMSPLRVKGPRRPGERISNQDLLKLMYAMDDNELTILQMQMWEAGFYEGDERPDWGVIDGATTEAMQQLMYESLSAPNATIDEVLADFAAGRIAARAEETNASRAQAVRELEAQLSSVEIQERVSAETIESTINMLSEEFLGEWLSDDEKDELIRRLQARQSQNFMINRDAQVANLRTTFQAADEVPGLDAFMAALAGQESGSDDPTGGYGDTNTDSGAHGRYQIMPSNWSAWARAAGLPGDAPQTPENQEIVARNQVMTYYRMFGNWRDVAIAWYAGPGRVAQLAGGKDMAAGGDYPSVQSYADQVLARMGGTGDDVDAMLDGLGSDYTVQTIDAFDLQAEAEAMLKAQDPVGWAGHEYSQRALDFQQILGSSVPT